MGLYFNIALFLPYKKYEGNEIILNGYIIERKISFNENRENGEYVIKVNRFDNYKLLKSIKIKVYINKEFEVGDRITFKGIYTQGEESRNYKGFSYRNYLRQNGIMGIVSVQDENNYKIIKEENNVEIVLMKLKEKVNLILEKYFSENCLGFMQGLLFGNKNNLTKEINELFKDTSISHVLAISGAHVVIVLISFENVLKIVSKNKRLNYYLEIIFLIIFYILTGMQVSCLRSTLFNIITIIEELRFEKKNIFKIVIFTYFILILVNFYNVINIGMYLSFLSSISIMVFNRIFTKLYDYIIGKKVKINNKILKYIYEFFKLNFIVSIVAQILILPIMIYNFNFFSFNFIISNLFISIFSTILLKTGYVIVLLDIINIFNLDFVLYINQIIAEILSAILELDFDVLDFIRKLKFLNIVFNTPNIIFVYIYYLVILILIDKFNENVLKSYKCILIFLNKKRRIKILQGKNIILNKIELIKKETKKYKNVCICLIIILICNSSISLFINKRFKFVFCRCRSGRLYLNKTKFK